MAQVSNRQRAEAALRTLGKLSVDGITELFLKLGVKGKKSHCSACPIWVYLKRRGVRRHCVGRFRVEFNNSPSFIYLPESAGDFIRLFDRGHCPVELIAA